MLEFQCVWSREGSWAVFHCVLFIFTLKSEELWEELKTAAQQETRLFWRPNKSFSWHRKVDSPKRAVPKSQDCQNRSCLEAAGWWSHKNALTKSQRRCRKNLPHYKTRGWRYMLLWHICICRSHKKMHQMLRLLNCYQQKYTEIHNV